MDPQRVLRGALWGVFGALAHESGLRLRAPGLAPMSESFRVPGLYFFSFDAGAGRATHIGRTNLAGCRTECGLLLVKGQVYRRRAPEDERVCEKCAQAIRELPYIRGFSA